MVLPVGETRPGYAAMGRFPPEGGKVGSESLRRNGGLLVLATESNGHQIIADQLAVSIQQFRVNGELSGAISIGWETEGGMAGFSAICGPWNGLETPCHHPEGLHQQQDETRAVQKGEKLVHGDTFGGQV
jgi:hypothetical protein